MGTTQQSGAKFKRWYEPDKKNPDDEMHRAGALLEETASIETRQAAWHELNLWNATLYTNRVLIGFRWGESNADAELWPSNLRTENLVESIGESMLAKASSSPLRPSLEPHGMSWKVERAVRIADDFLFGVWKQTRAEDAAVQMFRDAYMSGLGCVRVHFDSQRKTLHAERVFFDNIVIDNRECANGAMPRTYRIRQVLPRASVEAAYGVELPKQRKYLNHRDVGDGWVVLVEAWRLPDANGKGGRHSVACCGELLDDEAWTDDWVPLIFWHWQDRTSGFFVKSGVEQVMPFQVIHNDLNDDIRLAQDLCCRPRLMVNANSQIDVSQWDSEAGRFLMWAGSKPETFTWQTNISELYQERERNKAGAFSHMGLSEMFAQADMPSQVRLDSSAGVREFRNMEDARHLRKWTTFEEARLMIAKTLFRVLSRSPGADAFSAVYHPAGASAKAKSIPWDAVKTLVDDHYSWTMEATPLSQMAPAARRELIRDWTSRGLIEEGSEEAKRMEGNADLERIEKLDLASADDIARHISLVEDGDFEAPTELTNVSLGVKEFTANYHRLKAYDDVKTSVLENHVKWIVKGVAIQQAAIQAMQPPEPPTPFAPTQGMPGTNASTVPGPPSAQ